MNEHVALEKNGEKIALIGIENWGGKGRFAQYGRMDLAYKGAEHFPFKILMSHDPSHWEVQVRPKYPDVDLTLSGHTHGMQMGIEIPGLKWSPVQYMYKQWAGLYKSGKQFLYVNRGLGFIGYPGRVGIWPEITVLELQKA
jgi:predicted MPP superfamily phosphohydrolase